MDDRHLPLRTAQPRVVRAGEFYRLGKSLPASAYERIVPIARMTLCGVPSPTAAARRQPLPAARKAGA